MAGRFAGGGGQKVVAYTHDGVLVGVCTWLGGCIRQSKTDGGRCAVIRGGVYSQTNNSAQRGASNSLDRTRPEWLTVHIIETGQAVRGLEAPHVCRHHLKYFQCHMGRPAGTSQKVPVNFEERSTP
eukprot:1157563-Pelagomonas_calceolata.AAC.2